MTDEDKKLKEIFKRGIDGLNEGTPDFRGMMEKVVERPGRKNWFSLKIAASVILFMAVGVFLIVRNQGTTNSENYTLTEWNEPTRELMTLSSSSSSSTISTWSSPTDFLLSNNAQQIKN
jgi:hypothetical protein